MISNHGSFYFNQLAALKLIADDIQGAKNVTNAYFDGIYMNQIAANGEQVSIIMILFVILWNVNLNLKPLEVNRTRPYHYRAYNLAAMIVSFVLAFQSHKTYWAHRFC